ncbi:ABC transporter permease [Halorussus sp. MSC15.2]|uniref:ABC transporter permease n=1 Tax=Halorussus sp. MSC15.2 TaxID=2283638 RepID=UPI0013D3DE6C|nr:ABC transporter permease [Halorussus sp. MSC15.2]NEU58715.1 ABC transporter permease [Halorussus sp. MSC15.2]
MATDSSKLTELADDDSPSLLALVKVVFYKQYVLFVRYPVNTASLFLTLVAFFSLVFFGGKAIAGPSLTDSLNGIIVGFFLFTLSITSYSGLAWNVTREAQWGTLERLFMSPHGFRTVMAVKSIVNIAFSFLWGAGLLVFMMATTGRWLTVDPLTILPLLALTLMSIVGIGFLFAGLALVYKRIENLFQIVQFAFVGLIAAPAGDLEVLKLLPVTHGSYLTRRAMEDSIRLWEFPATEIGLLVATSVVYFTIGYYSFYRAGIRARQNGLLGHY